MRRGGKPPQCKYTKVRLQNQDEKRNFKADFESGACHCMACSRSCRFGFAVCMNDARQIAGERG